MSSWTRPTSPPGPPRITTVPNVTVTVTGPDAGLAVTVTAAPAPDPARSDRARAAAAAKRDALAAAAGAAKLARHPLVARCRDLAARAAELDRLARAADADADAARAERRQLEASPPKDLPAALRANAARLADAEARGVAARADRETLLPLIPNQVRIARASVAAELGHALFHETEAVAASRAATRDVLAGAVSRAVADAVGAAAEAAAAASAWADVTAAEDELLAGLTAELVGPLPPNATPELRPTPRRATQPPPIAAPAAIRTPPPPVPVPVPPPAPVPVPPPGPTLPPGMSVTECGYGLLGKPSIEVTTFDLSLGNRPA